jgi:L-ascorbate metabolism protein UlaG (beta-lactamase superfamily)
MITRPGGEKFVLNPKLTTINPRFKGNAQINERFVSKAHDAKGKYKKLLRWKFSANPQAREKSAENYRLGVTHNESFMHSDQDMLVWLGHAAFFIRIAGVAIVTDPVYFSLPFVPRLAPVPINPEKITPVDYILISHGHRDHLDLRSLKLLSSRNTKATVLGPLGIPTVLQKYKITVQAAGWYQQFITKPEIKIYFLPAAHWHRRGVSDYNKMLWGSFIIEGGGKTIFFAGDTAKGEHFAQINELFPQIDIALLPIGAYKPAYIMKASHLSPVEAVAASNQLKTRMFVPMHYGTYDLANEPLGEPINLLKQNSGKVDGELQVINPGEELLLE